MLLMMLLAQLMLQCCRHESCYNAAGMNYAGGLPVQLQLPGLLISGKCGLGVAAACKIIDNRALGTIIAGATLCQSQQTRTHQVQLVDM